MEILWSKKGYFGLSRKTHILVYYPIIYYRKIWVYKVENWIWEYYIRATVSVENAILLSTVVLIVWGYIL